MEKSIMKKERLFTVWRGTVNLTSTAMGCPISNTKSLRKNTRGLRMPCT
jgi:hypothetical protein